MAMKSRDQSLHCLRPVTVAPEGGFESARNPQIPGGHKVSLVSFDDSLSDRVGWIASIQLLHPRANLELGEIVERRFATQTRDGSQFGHLSCATTFPIIYWHASDSQPTLTTLLLPTTNF